MHIYILIALACLVTLFHSCKKNDEPETTSVIFNLKYAVDDVALLFDTLFYVNDAGNEYSVTRLQYYLSGIRFTGADAFQSNEIFYVDARINAYNSITIENVPQGDYTGISFFIGLSAVQNLTDALPNTSENLAMAWPDMMGGGYHFLKLEGHHKTAATQPTGYAVHLGNNMSLVTCDLDFPFSITTDQQQLTLKMNLNNWYRTPHQFDFNTDGNYTMGDSTLMSKIAANGHNVFTVPD